jgi:hypothetical protein
VKCPKAHFHGCPPGKNREETDTGAFSSEVDTGSREENASKQEPGASVLIPSEPIVLQSRSQPG